MTDWSKDIVTDLNFVNNKSLSLNDFVKKHWERFKPVYINYHGFIEDDAELYLLVYNFFKKIIRSDVQPLFNSDNQIFSYFRTAVKNKHYDDTHKHEINPILFTELNSSNELDEDNVEDKLPNSLDSLSVEEKIISEDYVEYLFSEVSKLLSEPYIKLLVLLYKGLTPKEARKELGVSITTIRDRIGVIRDTVNALRKINEK